MLDYEILQISYIEIIGLESPSTIAQAIMTVRCITFRTKY